jgi:hypothetical protein
LPTDRPLPTVADGRADWAEATDCGGQNFIFVSLNRFGSLINVTITITAHWIGCRD